jgi:hypothetical protein
MTFPWMEQSCDLVAISDLLQESLKQHNLCMLLHSVKICKYVQYL